MKPELGKRVCELVAGICETDGEFHLEEGTVLRRVMTRLGLPAHGVRLAPILKGAEAARAMSELPEEVRLEAFELLVDAAIVDGKVVEAERRYLEAVAPALGIEVAQLQRHVAHRLEQG